jgi:hypothetical protein
VAQFVDVVSEEAAAALEAVLNYAGTDAITGPRFANTVDAMMREIVSVSANDGDLNELSYMEQESLPFELAALVTAASEYIGEN